MSKSLEQEFYEHQLGAVLALQTACDSARTVEAMRRTMAEVVGALRERVRVAERKAMKGAQPTPPAP